MMWREDNMAEVKYLSGKLNTTKPPKNREFLGLVQNNNGYYWDFFWWATRQDGVNGAAQFVDREFFAMPKLIGWIELPEVEEVGEG